MVEDGWMKGYCLIYDTAENCFFFMSQTKDQSYANKQP